MNKYQLKITSRELSIKPYFGFMPKIKAFALLSVLIFATVPFMGNWMNNHIRYTLYGIGAIMVFYAIYDFLFNVNVKFLFDKNAGVIYRINAPFLRQRLMTFEEMTIINVSGDPGCMEYAIGQKKKQFMKNYSISDTFTNSKKSNAREQEYVEQVLNPILEFVKSDHSS
ncbi:hypothetical protein [Chitinophaga sp. Ak27]|uniref:hypothetical protein n=1 Tax=Chitinophaga sp. Ak27 TaxID=2726116 RepID=UPI00145F513D|nr:hypothetical protein [Chitinophaga sp. Ak27]NLU96094.1 hypothetical protein [Chitinophaga sp. Ak27]